MRLAGNGNGGGDPMSTLTGGGAPYRSACCWRILHLVRQPIKDTQHPCGIAGAAPQIRHRVIETGYVSGGWHEHRSAPRLLRLRWSVYRHCERAKREITVTGNDCGVRRRRQRHGTRGPYFQAQVAAL